MIVQQGAADDTLQRMRYLGVICAVLAAPAFAGEPTVVDVQARDQGGSWRFDVTVAHGDTGWDHYADGWRIYAPDGTELGYRELLHPHVNEQPFTRSLSGVTIPEGIGTVTVRASDSVHGEGPAVSVPLPGR